MSTEDEKLMLWRRVEGKKSWGNKFETNVIKLNMEFETQT